MEIHKSELKETIGAIIKDNEIIKIIISNPISKSKKYKKIIFENKINHYMIVSYTEKQSFTSNIDMSEFLGQLCSLVEDYK